MKVFYNKELKLWSSEKRGDRAKIKALLRLISGEAEPKGWTSVPRQIIEKVGYETMEIPDTWAFTPKQKKQKNNKKQFTLGEILPSS